MIARVTARLGKKIGVSPSHSLPVDANPYADWSAHLFTVNRLQYILLTNTVSLYSIVIQAKGITSDRTFLSRMAREMGAFMRKDGHQLIYERCVAPATEQVTFSKALSRAVTGSMNDLIFEAKCFLIDSEASLCDVSLRLNETPLAFLNYSFSREAFMAMTDASVMRQAGLKRGKK